jgi:nicotinamidase-related amidase
MSTLPAIDAPNGAYRERAFDPTRTALLNIDMQNGEFNADILALARTSGTPQSNKRAFYERIAATVIPNQARLQDAARKAGVEVIFTVIESLTQDGRDSSLDHKISNLHFPKGSWEAKVIDGVGRAATRSSFPRLPRASSMPRTSTMSCAILASTIW